MNNYEAIAKLMDGIVWNGEVLVPSDKVHGCFACVMVEYFNAPVEGGCFGHEFKTKAMQHRKSKCADIIWIRLEKP